jgi:hypothetical protein
MTRPSFATLPAATILAICDHLEGDGHELYDPAFLAELDVPAAHVQSVTRTYRSDGSPKGTIFGQAGVVPETRAVYSLDLYRRIAADLGVAPSAVLGRGVEARDLDRRIRQQVQAQEARP